MPRNRSDFYPDIFFRGRIQPLAVDIERIPMPGNWEMCFQNGIRYFVDRSRKISQMEDPRVQILEQFKRKHMELCEYNDVSPRARAYFNTIASHSRPNPFFIFRLHNCRRIVSDKWHVTRRSFSLIMRLNKRAGSTHSSSNSYYQKTHSGANHIPFLGPIACTLT